MDKLYVTEYIAEKLQAKGYPYSNIIHFDGGVPIVRIDEVLEWLREEKKIYLEFIIVDDEYTCNIYKIEPRPVKWVGSTDFFSKIYEIVVLSGIDYVIDNLI